jgi:hypothetical protein
MTVSDGLVLFLIFKGILLKRFIFEIEIAQNYEILFFLTSRSMLMPHAAEKFGHIFE